MSNVTRLDAGSIQQWERWEFKHPQLTRPAKGKLFLNEALGLTGMEASLNSLPAGAAVPFFHRHREHEELYLILSGKGEFQVDGELYAVEEGSALRIAPEGVRSWRNVGDEPMIYIVVQATHGSLTQKGIADGEVVEGLRW